MIHVYIGCAGLCCLLASLIVIVTVVLLVPDKNDDNNSQSSSISVVIDQVVSDIIQDDSEWEDSQSPAQKAYGWITEKDQFFTSAANNQLLLSEQAQQTKVRQRFVLAFLYFHTTQTSWKTCVAAETGEDKACLYRKLESYSNQGEYFDQVMVEPSYRWLSDVDECRWAGVDCVDGIITALGLGGNGLTGSFPAELAHLDQLQVLDLQQNDLEGQLPPDYLLGSTSNSPSSLRVLRLDRNNFSGSIPESWCGFEGLPLEQWSLASNQLTGPLPACLNNLQSLMDFSALHNQLTGTTIPVVGGENLQRLHLADNLFDSGSSIPKSICELESMTELSADCLDETSSNFVQCDCCTKCCDEDICELYGP